jgi:hypothetical protein
LLLELLQRQFLEEASKEVSGVVDQHVDPVEAGKCRLHCGLGGRCACDVQLDYEQIV